MSSLPRWVEDELESFLKVFIPIKLLKDGIESQEGHGERNVITRANQPKTN
jgi:hypothetical protein